jgi:hypothetical protein
MKKATILVIAGILLFIIPARSQDIKTDTIRNTSIPTDQFKEDLKASVDDFDLSKNVNECISASNHLSLIAKKYPEQWAANYYACYSLTVLSYIEKDAKKKDAYLDDAEVFLNNAFSDYKSDFDELYVLKAMFANARLAVQPATRYKKYGDQFNENIEKAKSLQPDNPRIYYLKGNSVYYTPKMFGGGAKNALPLFEKAESLFENESNDDIYKPYWGEKQNDEMIVKCKGEIK